MIHSFDVDIAVKYGVNEAIILNSIAYWVAKNEANGTNFFEGRYWTYNSTKAFNKLFPYMSTRTIRRVLAHLVDEGLIVIGHFNTKKMDRTSYYGLSNLAHSIVSKGQMEKSKMDQREVQNGPIFSNSNIYIDNNNTVITSVITTDIPPISPVESLFEQFWKAYPNRRKTNKKGCLAKFKKIKDVEKLFPDIMASLELQKRSKDWTKQNGEFIPAPMTWINQERWTLEDERSERQQIADELAAGFIDGFFD